jgi:hypothetical protein
VKHTPQKHLRVSELLEVSVEREATEIRSVTANLTLVPVNKKLNKAQKERSITYIYKYLNTTFEKKKHTHTQEIYTRTQGNLLYSETMQFVEPIRNWFTIPSKRQVQWVI